MTSKTRKYRDVGAGFLYVISLTIAVIVFTQAHRDTRTLLQAEQDKLDAIQAYLDSDDHGYAILDERGNVVEWNVGLEKLSGYTEAELQGKSLYSVMFTDDWERHHETFSKAMRYAREKGTKVSVLTCRMPHKDGSGAIPVKITIRIVKTRNNNYYAVAHVDEVSNVQYITPEANGG